MANVAVVGAGVAGLAASIRLARQGHQVQVFEANAYPGGKLTQIQKGGYRFDAGPSLFTLPQLVEELFELAGEDVSQHFEYIRLPVTCHYFYDDGTRITGHANKQDFAAEVAQKIGEAPDTVINALQHSALLYETLSGLFMWRSLHRRSTWFNKEAFRAYGRLHKMDFFRTMHKANKQRFKDPRTVQLFNRFATYNGSNPYQTPATLSIIPHLEFNIGAFFPKNGMHAITQALYGLAQRSGVQFHFNSPVQQIVLQNKQVQGVKVNNELVPAQVVVSNMDVVNTYKRLLTQVPPPNRLLRQPKSSSALIFYWGIKKSFAELDLHNIFFSQDYQAEFDHIFNKGSLYHDPTVYVNITSKYKPDDAPEDCENWFTMINVPNNQGQDWNQLIEQARGYIIQKLSKVLGQDVASLIEVEDVLDPRLIEQRTASAQGALYGNSSNNKYAAFMRHANFSQKYKGLYFCGGSVHPGGGIPLCLSSARIAAQEVQKQYAA